MKIKHHPDDSTLMSYAAGSLAEALSAVVATHLAMCRVCAAEVTTMERIGVALFERLEGKPIERPLPQMALRAMEADVGGGMPVVDQGGDVPAPLRPLIGPRIADIRWKRLGMGIWNLPLKLANTGEGDLRLLRVAAGQAMPEHGHGGAELTLILCGSYRDEFGEYHAGDVADLDADAEHRPIADPREGCICLIASEKRARFKGLFGRIVQPLTGF
jgi:putative transcriptional regulator